MTDKNFTLSFTVDQTPQQVFDAINNVRGWWSEAIEGKTDKLDEVFFYSFRDIHRATFKITEFEPGKKIVWHVLQNYFNFVDDTTEWTGTDVVFEINEKGGKTELTFTHIGLVPKYACYEACSEGWTNYIYNNLQNLITTGKGDPNVGKAQTKTEEKLSA